MNFIDYFDYAQMQVFARSWGLVFLTILFLCAVAYALRPKNKEIFDHMSKLPLIEDEDGKPSPSPMNHYQGSTQNERN